MTTKSTGELFPVLEQIERDKGIKKEDILKMIESALVSAFRKHSGRLGNIKVQVDPENGTIKAYLVKKVVNEINNPNYEMSLEEAKNFSPEVVLDTEIEIPIETEDFSRIAAQTAKQVIIQKIREIERDNLYSEFLTKKSQVLGGFVHRFVDRNIIVDLGKIEAILPLREQIRGERLNIGDRIKVYVVKVDKGPRGPQILVSRTHPELVKGLFAQEVPEVNDHTVEIVGISREPGIRSKLAMISHNQRVDPVGTCVGVHGSRIKPIIGELRGERIDLIHWDNEPGKLISQALTPAKDIKVNIINPEGKRAEVIVADAQLSMAIGKSGINVRLASRLTGWYLDIKSESEKKEELAKETTVGLTELQKISGIGPKLAETLQKAGYKNIEDLAKTKIEELTALQGIGEKTAEKLIRLAKEYLAESSLLQGKEEKTDG
jgi:N utilization substance protein A